MSLLKNGDGRKHGPELLGKAGAAGAQSGGKGILSQLEHGIAGAAAAPALRWRPGWRHWTAGALCLAVLVTAVLAYDTAVLPLPPTPTPATASMATTTAPPAATVLPPATPAMPAMPTTQAAATIVNTAGTALPAAPATTASASAPRKTPPVRQAATRQQGPRPAAVSGDSDVALLTAMVSHAHRQEVAPPARDVVLRSQEEETAELLRRCQLLGLIEGMLCRSRICSGRWGSDPACH